VRERDRLSVSRACCPQKSSRWKKSAADGESAEMPVTQAFRAATVAALTARLRAIGERLKPSRAVTTEPLDDLQREQRRRLALTRRIMPR